MPLVKLSGKRERPASAEPEEAEAPAGRPMPLPVEDEPVEPGRPHQAFVEDEARRYWQEMGERRDLTKPDRQKIREAAMPILRKALQKRMGSKLNPALRWGHLVVIAMQEHLAERGLLRRGYTRSEKIPNYMEALLQLADDAGWLYHEIPLPDHPAPRHPPIHYTIDPNTGEPVPTEESLIRGDYVYDVYDGSRLTQGEYIYPWRDPDKQPSLDDVTSRGWKACYIVTIRRTISLEQRWGNSAERLQITYFYTGAIAGRPTRWIRRDRAPLEVGGFQIAKGGIYYSPRAPTEEDLHRLRMNIEDVRSDAFLWENLITIFS